MKILVLGATGGTGRQLVSLALADGHEVMAITRKPGALAAQNRLTSVSDLTGDPGDFERAIADCDAVLCALGGRPWRRTEQVCSTAIAKVVPLMEKHGVRRIVAISTFGAGDTRPQVGWIARALVFELILRREVADKEAMEKLLSASALDWTVVRVGVLTDEPGRGTWRAADDGSIRGMGKIPRADVASFMLAQLTSDAWLRRKPVLMS